MKIIRILTLLICVVSPGCDLVRMRDETDTAEEKTKALARVYDTQLYEDDVRGIVPANVSSQDSADIISRYIKGWIKKQLLINEAASRIDFDEAELQRKILDYRYALMVYEFEKQYVNEELNKEVLEEEVLTYYKENIANFELKQNIIRGLYIKVPKEAPKIERLKRLIRSDKDKDKAELKSYCFRFATSYSLEDSLWVNFDEVIRNTPLISIPNKVQFLKENKYIETEDADFLYLIRVYDFKISDQTSPLEFVRDEIKDIIINKRKLELSRQLEEKIYNEAKENNDFEVYSEP